MAEPTDQPDLRALAAEAIPYELISTPAVGIGGARRIMLAEVVLAAVLPAHRDMVLEEAARMILDHADEHFPADGSDEQGRMRRHLRIAARIVTPEWRRHIAATTPADGLSASVEPEVDPAVPGTATRRRMSAMAERAEARRVTSPDYPDSPEHVAEQSATTEALAAWQSEAMRDCGQPQAAENAPAVGREATETDAGYEDFIAAEHFTEGPTYLDLVPRADLSRVTRERDLLKVELEIGRQVQRSLMDEVLRCVADLRIAAARVAELEAAAADREQGGIERAEQANG